MKYHRNNSVTNKKDGDFKYSVIPMKTPSILAVIAVLLLTLTIGCVGSSEPASTTPGTPITPTEQQQVQEQVEEAAKCPVEFGIPLDLKVYEKADENFPYFIPSAELNRIDWKGWEYEKDFMNEDLQKMYCNFGELSGENVNNLYCGGSINSEVSKKIIAEDGTVVGTDRFYLGITFKPSGDGFVLDKMFLKDNMFREPMCGVQY